MPHLRSLTPLVLAGLLAACGDDGPSEPGTGELVVQARAASSFSPPPAAAAQAVDPSRFTMSFYRIYLASDADCSSPTLLADNGSTPTPYDLLTDPTLFTADGDPGTYRCLILRISDILEFVPATTEGPCMAGTTYRTDVYRNGETDWRDVDGTPIVGRGEDATPVDDSPDIFFTTDRAAVVARGFSPNQVQSLVSPAVVPGTATFVYDLDGTIADEGGSCRAIPGTYEFR